MTIRLRPATAADGALLARATLENLNWSGPRFEADDVEKRPEFRHYHRGWPTGSDYGYVAELATGEAVGAVWLRFFPAHDPGYGYVSAEVPELSVWVVAEHRGFGLGERLIHETIRRARERGLGGISLSVEEDNPARRLYERMGFRPAGDDHPATTLLLRV